MSTLPTPQPDQPAYQPGDIADIKRLISFLFSFTWYYFPSLFFAFACAYLFWFREEGIDLIRALTDSAFYIFGFFPSLFLWAVITWYTSWLVTKLQLKLITDKQHPVFGSPKLLNYTPLVLGLFCFMILGVAILNFIFLRFNWGFWWLTGLLLLQVFLLFLFALAYHGYINNKVRNAPEVAKNEYLNRISRKARWTAIISFVVLGISSLVGLSGTFLYVSVLLVIYVLSTVYVILAMNRSIYMDEIEMKPFVIKRITFYLPDKTHISTPFKAYLGICLLAFLIALFSPALSIALGTISGVLLSFAFLLGFANVASFFSVQLRINLHFVFIFVSIIVGMFLNPYNVRTLKLDENHLTMHHDRKSVEQHFNEWMNANRKNIQQADSVKGYPLFFVITHGGASRSGYWTASVLSELEDRSEAEFSKHLFALGGASGGSVGNAVFLSLLQRKTIEGFDSIGSKARNYLGNDFLSFTMNRLMGSDFIGHILPFMWILDDRAIALENSFEHQSFLTKENPTSMQFSRPFLTIWDSVLNKGKFMPALFINTTRVQDASPGLISNLKIDASLFSNRIDVLGKVDSAYTLSLSTAVVLGARFAYVSPAGRLGDSYYVDGGYFDNSGAGAILNVIEILKNIIDKNQDALYKKLRFKLIHITNDKAPKSDLSGIHPVTNDAAAPLITILGSYTMQTEYNNKRLKETMNELGDQSKGVNYFSCDLHKGEDSVATETFPMNWYISKTKRQSMDSAMLKCRTIESILFQLPEYAKNMYPGGSKKK